MRDRSQLIANLQSSQDSRASYIRSKVGVIVASQLYALRVTQPWTQKQFAEEAGMKQSRISAMEQPGAVKFSLETLVRSAATFGVGLVVKFVPFSEMLEWENNYSQDTFNPARLDQDRAFLDGRPASTQIWTYRYQDQLVPLLEEETNGPKALYGENQLLYSENTEGDRIHG